jgi:hypothetical protein
MSENKAMHAPPPRSGRGDSLKVKRVECEELVVKGPGRSGFKVTASAVKDCAGIWIEGPDGADGPLVAVYQTGGEFPQTCVGLYAAGEKTAVNIGMAVSADGEPFFQLVRGDRVVHVTMDQLAGLA